MCHGTAGGKWIGRTLVDLIVRACVCLAFCAQCPCAAAVSSLMSRDRDQGRTPPPWANYPHNGAAAPLGLSTDLDPPRTQQSPSQQRNPYSAPPSNPAKLPERPNLPTRSSTLGPTDPDRNLPSHSSSLPKARSEDLNHTSAYASNSFISSSPRPSPPYLSSGAGSSRPNTPGTSKDPSSSGLSDQQHSMSSHSSAHSEASTSNSNAPRAPPSTSSTSTSLSST